MLFEFVRNGDVNAINYFATAQDSLKRNQFGGTVGGQIIRDKLFFFGGIQETIVRQNPSGSSAFIPTAAALNGDFSALDGAACQANGIARAINDPATGAPLPNDFINPNRFDPAALNFMKYLPVSSANSCGKISYGVPVIYNARQYVTRVDWTINPKHSLYGRYLAGQLRPACTLQPDQLSSTPPRWESARDRRPSCLGIPTRSTPTY